VRCGLEFTEPLRTIAVRLLAISVIGASSATAALIPSQDGLTVYDTVLHVTWLANANPAATLPGVLGVARIAPNGAMNYQTAVQWVAAFSFGNGFQGTDLMVNDLYVMVYFPGPEPRHRSVRH